VGSDPLEEASRVHDVAVSLRDEGQYEAAAALARRALAAFEAETGPDHPDIANILNTWAGVHEDRGDYAEAERLYRRSVDIMEQVTGDLELEMLRVQSWRKLAGLYRVQGRYE